MKTREIVLKKIISFSLWGQDLKYLVGAVKNCDLAKSIYPGWICRFYIAQSVPQSFVTQISQRNNTEIVMMPEWGDWKALYWRFRAADDKDVDVVISRDTDSRLNKREAEAVNQWIESNKSFHIMRDHPYHRFLVLGGMWGAKKHTFENLGSLIDSFQTSDAYGTDYDFWQKVGLKSISEDQIMIHDEFFSANCSFPSARDGLEFVGKVFDENDETVIEHEKALEKYLSLRQTQDQVILNPNE